MSDEPRQHDRPEERAHAIGAVLLHAEDGNQDRDRHRDHVRLEQRRRDVDPLDRAEHGDRRRDHPVAVEQRRAEDAEQHQQPTASALGARMGSERGQRENASLALVVGAQHDGDVLHRHHQQQRVDDQGQHAEDVLVGRRHRVGAVEALAQCVERAGADVAVDDAQSSERERRGALANDLDSTRQASNRADGVS